jgi:hypothetical protein
MVGWFRATADAPFAARASSLADGLIFCLRHGGARLIDTAHADL